MVDLLDCVLAIIETKKLNFSNYCGLIRLFVLAILET